MTELVKYDAARKALAEARTVDEVKDIHDKAAAMGLYARMANDRQMEADAIEIRMRAERRLGDMIAAQKATVGLAKAEKKTGPLSGFQKTQQGPPTLIDAGIDKNLAHRARKAAKMDAEEFEEKMKQARNPAPKAKHKPKGERQHKAAVTRRINVEPADWEAFMARAKSDGMTAQDRLGKLVKNGEERKEPLPVKRSRREPTALEIAENGLKMAKETISHQRRENAALKKEIAALSQLPDGIVPRYRAFCKKIRAQEKAYRVAFAARHQKRMDEAVDQARQRNGVIPDDVWADLMRCLHPDGRPSATVLSRTFIALRDREDILRAGAVKAKALSRLNGQQTGNGVARA